jgi:polar amino acid transport system substrate-binding protein
MKKFLALLMASALVLSMAACGSSDSSSAAASSAAASSASQAETAAAASTEETTEAAEAETSGTTTFTVGFDAEYPPYGYMDENGDYVGFDLDLAQEVCDRNGWTLVKQPIDWDAKDMELNSGSIDCIWNGFTMTGREDSYTFSVPYVDNSIVFVVMNDSDIQSAADLAGKIVVTQADSSALAALTDEEDNQENLDLAATFADLQQVADYNTAFLNLESGVVDAIAVDIGVAQYQLTSRGDTFRMLEEPLSTEQYGIGFKLGNEELRDAVQATLFEMYKDGTVDEIAAKYADYNLPDMLCLGNYVD